MKYILSLLVIGILGITGLEAQWLSINPGAGGQVQDVVGDPSNPGTLYLASDMEGVYKSTDNGESWDITGVLMHNRVYAVTVDPGNPERLYVGTLYGLHTSDDGGDNYDFVFPTRGTSIGCIAVDPASSENVIVGPGRRDDSDFISKLDDQANGVGMVYLTKDGGVGWDEIIFDSNPATDKNIWNICYDQNNTSIVYLGSTKGIFKSSDGGSSWSKIPNPAGGSDNRGVSLSPDGSVLYAAYNTTGKIFATPTSSISWQEVMQGDGISLSNFRYWYPEVDSRSTGSSHKLLVGMQGQREGLFEGTFNWTGSILDSYSWKRIWHDDGGWDRGWDYATPNARYAHYTPAGWDRAVWSTTNQTIYEGVPAEDAFSWNNKYCIPHTEFQVPHWGQMWSTYSSRGSESTYTYDIAVHENYVIQGQGDNGFMESWDYGKSWNNMQHRREINLSDVQAVDIADAWGTAVVVAQATSGYGGWATDGRLYVKPLKGHAPTDSWVHLGAGPQKLLGIEDGILRDVAVSPANPAKVFMFSTNHGMYMIEDLGRTMAYQKQGKTLIAQKIFDSKSTGANSVKKIAPHPLDEDIVFFNSSSGTQGVYKGVNKDGDWTWTKVYNGYGWDSEVHCWDHEGQVYLMYAGFASGGQGDGNHTVVALSLDEGATWKKIFTKEKAKALRLPDWYEEWKDIYNFTTKGGPAAHGNTIVVNYYHHGYQLGYGIFKGTIQTDGNITWEDWTGDLHFPGPTSSIFAENRDSLYFYTSTAGAGAWQRNIGPASAIPEAPATPSSLDAQASSSSTISLSWEDVADESGYRIQRKSGTGDFSTIGQLGRNSISYSDFDLEQGTTYTYRILAFNQGGLSGYSPEALDTTLVAKDIPCEASNLIGNGDFEEELVGWRLYMYSGAEASLELSDEPGFPGEKSAKVSIGKTTSLGRETDIQFYYPFVGLEANTGYEVSFRAKASQQETLHFLVLLNQAPWTNILSKTLTLTTDARDFGPYPFFIDDDPDSVRVDFFLGKSVLDVWIDDVVLEQTGDCVIEYLDEVQIQDCPPSMLPGETFPLAFSALPVSVKYPRVIWSTSDSSIAVVAQDGRVSALSPGQVTITLSPVNGAKSDHCEISILDNSTGIGETTEINETSGGLLYPNPLKLGSDFQVTMPYSGEVDMEIFDLSGRSIHKKSQASLVAGSRIVFSGAHISSKGMYLLTLTSREKITSLKLIVN